MIDKLNIVKEEWKEWTYSTHLDDDFTAVDESVTFSGVGRWAYSRNLSSLHESSWGDETYDALIKEWADKSDAYIEVHYEDEEREEKLLIDAVYKLSVENEKLVSTKVCVKDLWSFEGDELEKLIERAEDFNDVDAQNELGTMYSSYHIDMGVGEDDEKAVYWLTKAAENGNDDAQYTLGHHYFDGDGVEQDYAKAKYWYEKSGVTPEEATEKFNELGL